MIDSELWALKDFDLIVQNFHWNIPHEYNIANDICDKHAGTDKIAMYFEDESGNEKVYTFEAFMQYSNSLAAYLREIGIERNDRIAVFLPQGPEAAISHLAIFKLGAISVPFSTMFGPESVEHRLLDSGAKAIITDQDGREKLKKVRMAVETLRYVFIVGENEDGEIDFESVISQRVPTFRMEKTLGTDPAVIIYTSGTTGLPKGALHAHQCIPGRLSGFQLAHNFFPQPGDTYWSPAEWAWIGGLLDSLFTPWSFGVPVVVQQRKKFDPEKTFFLLSKYHVRNAFIPPTALKMLRNVRDVRSRYDLKMRSVHSGGEVLPAEILAWGKEVFGSLAEMYGMTEMGFIVGNCTSILKVKSGSMGKPYPGHPVEIIDSEGNRAAAGVLGEIAIHKSDPGMFLGYWNDPEATSEKFRGEWFLSNDMAYRDEEGYFWFRTRKDDVIISAGYRIGPSEIEKCVFGHPSVDDVAVVGSPDAVRGEVVKAFIQLKRETEPSDKIREEIQELVKTSLSAHEYPREIEFVSELPRTTTGKIKRSVLREQERTRKLGQHNVDT